MSITLSAHLCCPSVCFCVFICETNRMTALTEYAMIAVAYLGFGKGGHGEHAEREPITGVQGQS